MRDMDDNPLSDVIEGTLDEIEGIGTRGHTPAVPSGFKDFDSVNVGFRPGELTIIGGASGMGKSTLGLNLIRSCSIKNRRPSLLVSLQMQRNEMMMRILSAEGNVQIGQLRNGGMTDEDWTRLAHIMPVIAAAPITFQDSATFNLTELVRTARRLGLFGDLQMIVIDSLDLLYSGRDESSNLDLDLSFKARELRNLAIELRIPVVAFLQIEVPGPLYGHTPTLQQVPTSLERFADVVALLHRPDVHETDSIRKGEADIVIAKNRMGPTMTVRAGFHGCYARFLDLSPEA